ncbi:MAG: PhoH family protein [Thermodesulfobacteriota bacterium]
MPKRRKIFVLDTNVILHDSSCFHRFQEHDVVVPITVIEELDGFKKGGQAVNYHAREFTRALDALDAARLFNGGVPIDRGAGRIMVRLEKPVHRDLRPHFHTDSADHRILNVAYRLAGEHPSRPVILVSKDVNLRMKARSLGLAAEDYTSDHVKDPATLNRGCTAVDHLTAGVIEQLHAGGRLEPGEAGLSRQPAANEFLILRNGKQSALGFFEAAAGTVRLVRKGSASGITPRNAEQAFALDALMNRDIPLVAITGKAGTGKTLLALAAALERLHDYRQILLARPVVPLSNRDLGFLPGDVQAKLHPYMQPLYDNLAVIRGQFPEGSDRHRALGRLLAEGGLVIEPLAYIRGRSLVKLFVIVDESQNLTPHEVKTIVTRAGAGTRIVLTGDLFQIDHPYLDTQSNGLSHLIDKLAGQPLFAHVHLAKGERSQLADLASDLL